MAKTPRYAFSPYPQHHTLADISSALISASNAVHECQEACRGKKLKTALRHWNRLQEQLTIARDASLQLGAVDGRLKPTRTYRRSF